MSEEQQNPQQHNTNCLNCNKLIKKIKQYYRSGKYYCHKQCWKSFVAKQKQEAQK